MLFSELCVLQIDVVIKSRIFNFVCNLVNNNPIYQLSCIPLNPIHQCVTAVLNCTVRALSIHSSLNDSQIVTLPALC